MRTSIKTLATLVALAGLTLTAGLQANESSWPRIVLEYIRGSDDSSSPEYLVTLEPNISGVTTSVEGELAEGNLITLVAEPETSPLDGTYTGANPHMVFSHFEDQDGNVMLSPFTLEKDIHATAVYTPAEAPAKGVWYFWDGVSAPPIAGWQYWENTSSFTISWMPSDGLSVSPYDIEWEAISNSDLYTPIGEYHSNLSTVFGIYADASRTLNFSHHFALQTQREDRWVKYVINRWGTSNNGQEWKGDIQDDNLPQTRTLRYSPVTPSYDISGYSVSFPAELRPGDDATIRDIQISYRKATVDFQGVRIRFF